MGSETEGGSVREGEAEIAEHDASGEEGDGAADVNVPSDLAGPSSLDLSLAPSAAAPIEWRTFELVTLKRFSAIQSFPANHPAWRALHLEFVPSLQLVELQRYWEGVVLASEHAALYTALHRASKGPQLFNESRRDRRVPNPAPPLRQWRHHQESFLLRAVAQLRASVADDEFWHHLRTKIGRGRTPYFATKRDALLECERYYINQTMSYRRSHFGYDPHVDDSAAILPPIPAVLLQPQLPSTAISTNSANSSTPTFPSSPPSHDESIPPPLSRPLASSRHHPRLFPRPNPSPSWTPPSHSAPVTTPTGASWLRTFPDAMSGSFNRRARAKGRLRTRLSSGGRLGFERLPPGPPSPPNLSPPPQPLPLVLHPLSKAIALPRSFLLFLRSSSPEHQSKGRYHTDKREPIFFSKRPIYIRRGSARV